MTEETKTLTAGVPTGMSGEELVVSLFHRANLCFKVDGSPILDDFSDGADDDQSGILFDWDDDEEQHFEVFIPYMHLDDAVFSQDGVLHCIDGNGEATEITIYETLRVTEPLKLLMLDVLERRELAREEEVEQQRRDEKNGLYGGRVDDAN